MSGLTVTNIRPTEPVSSAAATRTTGGLDTGFPQAGLLDLPAAAELVSAHPRNRVRVIAEPFRDRRPNPGSIGGGPAIRGLGVPRRSAQLRSEPVAEALPHWVFVLLVRPVSLHFGTRD